MSDEPDVGQHHGEPDQGVEAEDHRHALPGGQQRAALSQLLVLGFFVINHADDHQQETGRHLHRRSDQLNVVSPVSTISYLVTAKENSLRPGHSEAHQVKLPLLGESEALAGVDLVSIAGITGVVVLHHSEIVWQIVRTADR